MSAFRPLNAITEIIVHCSDTPNGRPHSIADIDAWHGPDRVARGLSPFTRSINARYGTGPWQGYGEQSPGLHHCGYHLVIGLEGITWEGRALTETGAHCKRHNRQSVGICLIGRDAFTLAQWEELRRVERYLRDELPGHLGLHGHREFASYKTCPGFDVRAWVAGGMAPLQDHVYSTGGPANV